MIDARRVTKREPKCRRCRDEIAGKVESRCHRCRDMAGGIMPACWGTAVTARDEHDRSRCNCPSSITAEEARFDRMEKRIAELEHR